MADPPATKEEIIEMQHPASARKYSQVAEQLIDLECILRSMNLWSHERPSEEDLASDQPFCVDTLRFEQWLQFVFIERMTLIVERELPLPDKCGLAPMAEECFRGAAYSPQTLIEKLQVIDRTLSS
jgi:uncharacterized protein YqcC (DUF446 family)